MSLAVRSLDSSARAALERLDCRPCRRRPCAPVRTLLPAGDTSAAYAVQSAWIGRPGRGRRRVAGRKIGLTNPAVQAQLGVGQPDFGTLLASMDCPPG